MSQYQKDYSRGTISEEVRNIVQCEDILEFSEGLAAIKQNGLWGYVNLMGEIVIPCQYTFAMSFSEGMAVVTLNSREGFIDKKGNLVVPFNHFFANDFREGLAVVSNDEGEEYGYIDKTGKQEIPYQYSYADDFYEGLAAVSKFIDDEELTGFINQQGDVVIDFKYLNADCFQDGYAFAEVSGYSIVINQSGEEAFKLPNTEEFKLRCCGEVILWAENDDWFYQNLNTGEKRGMPDMREMSYFGDGLIIINDKNGKHGAINKNGELIIPYDYDRLDLPNEGFISFQQKGKWGYLDYKGNVVIAPQYDEADMFSSGVAVVEKGKMKHVIDAGGQVLLSIKNESFWSRILRSNTVIKKVLIRILVLIIIIAVFYYLKQ